jgi:hypothetical protein
MIVFLAGSRVSGKDERAAIDESASRARAANAAAILSS